MKTYLIKFISEKGFKEMRIALNSENSEDAKLELFKMDFHIYTNMVKLTSVAETNLPPTIKINNKKINYIN